MLAFYMTYIEEDQDKDKFVVIYQTYVDLMVKIADNIPESSWYKILSSYTLST